MKIRHDLVALLLGVLVSVPALARPDGSPVPYEAALAAVSDLDCRSWVEFLASAELEGRESGQRGFDIASRYVASVLRGFGLEAGGDGGSFYQRFSLVRGAGAVEKASLTLRAAGDPSAEVLSLKGGIAMEAWRDIHWKGRWVFAGYGEGADLDAPDDFHGIPVEDSVVLIVPRPGRTSFEDRGAIAAGARRVVIASDYQVARLEGQRIRRAGAGFALEHRVEERRAVRKARGPEVVYITAQVADRILKRCGKTVAGLQSASERPKGFVFDGLEFEFELQVRSGRTEETQNVIAILRGSDPDLKDEFVVVGAHLDHVGARKGKIYHGADDNASGSAAVLGVAKALAGLPGRPRRSVAFLLFGAEEKGLLGSRYFVDRPTIPLEKIVLMVNLDMVGRDESRARGKGKGEKPEDNVNSLHIVGSKRLSRELDPWIRRLNSREGLEFEYDEERVWRRSDHFSFARRGIPVAFFFSGFHPDYHKPTDTSEKINYRKIVRVCRLVLALVYEVADRERRLKINRL